MGSPCVAEPVGRVAHVFICGSILDSDASLDTVSNRHWFDRMDLEIRFSDRFQIVVWLGECDVNRHSPPLCYLSQTSEQAFFPCVLMCCQY